MLLLSICAGLLLMAVCYLCRELVRETAGNAYAVIGSEKRSLVKKLQSSAKLLYEKNNELLLSIKKPVQLQPYAKEFERIRSICQQELQQHPHLYQRIASIIETVLDESPYKNYSSSHTLLLTAYRTFLLSIFVIGIAGAAAFINFQLIALPMSELVPSGLMVGSMPVASVAALVIVLLELAVGIFLLESMQITKMFSTIQEMAVLHRRILMAVSFAGLLFLAGVESSLAILREHLVEAESVLKASLAGGDGGLISQSKIPMIGQAVLGFVLPWIIAMVAIPLELMIETGQHVLLSMIAGLLYCASGLAYLVLGALQLVVKLLYVVHIALISPLHYILERE